MWRRYVPVPSNEPSSTSTAYDPATGKRQSLLLVVNEQPDTTAPVGAITRKNGLKFVPPWLPMLTCTRSLAAAEKLCRFVSARAAAPIVVVKIGRASCRERQRNPAVSG